MVLAVGEILFEFIPGYCFCPCISVVVFEMYSLIGSLVIIRNREAGPLAGTFMHASQFKYGLFRRQMGLRAVQKRFARVSGHVRSLHVLRPLSATRSLILNVSTCSSNPAMVRLP